MNDYRGMMETATYLYDLYREVLDDTGYERITYIHDQQQTRFLSIIQNDRHLPSVRIGNKKVNLIRKTSFCNKRIGCKRKRRKQL